MTAARTAANEKRFNLRLWVVLVGLCAIVVVNAALAFTLSRYVADRMIYREGVLAQEFLNSVLKAEGTADKLFGPDGAALDSFSRHVRNFPGLLRANIYSPDLVVRFSTDPRLLLTTPPDSSELKEALDGTVITGMNSEVGDTPQAKSRSLIGEDRRVIEAYLPMIRPGGGVVAVVEFYRDAESLNLILINITLIVWATAGLGGLLIFGALFGAITRASTVIAAQGRELQAMAIMASLGQLAAAVGHSLRNPLASIRSSVELLGIDHPDLQETVAADIVSEIERIDQHIHDLLDYARTEADPAGPVPLTPLILEAVDRLDGRMKRHGIALRLEVPEISPVSALEPRMFLQVLESVLTNALDSMPQGGEIHIRLSGQGKDKTVVEITDTGPGIPPAILERLPEPFLTTKQRGLGLGLSIAGRILARFGGRLRLENAEPHGARVIIELERI